MISCIKCGAKSEKCFSSLHSVCTAAAGEPKVPFKYFNHYKPLLTLHLCHIFQASYQICIFVIVVISPVFVDILRCLLLVFIIQKVSRVLFFSLYVCPALNTEGWESWRFCFHLDFLFVFHLDFFIENQIWNL